MSIIDLQRRLRQLGSIRIGDRVMSGKNERPNKLDKPRLTSPSSALIERAAAIYGGEVREWKSPAGVQFEVYTEAAELDVILPPAQMALSQWMELWSGGGCERRCDGETELLSDTPCICPEDSALAQQMAQKGEACRPTTRLMMMLPRIGDLGLWQLRSSGYHAAAELAGLIQDILGNPNLGLDRKLIPAKLRIEQRTAKKPGVGTLRYIVPVLELADLNVEQLVEGSTQALATSTPQAALPAGGASPAGGTIADSPLKTEPPAAAQAAPPAEPPAKKRTRAKAADRDASPSEPPSPRANADGEVLATPAQLRKLMVLSEKRGYSDEQRREAAGVGSFKELTKDRASKLINEWENGEPTDEPIVGEDTDEWEQSFQELQKLFHDRFGGPVARSRYRDTLLKRQGVDSLEDLTIKQIRSEINTLQKVSA